MALSSSFACAAGEANDCFAGLRGAFQKKNGKPQPVSFAAAEIRMVCNNLNNYSLEEELKSSLVVGTQALFSKIGSGDLVGAFSSDENYHAWLKLRSLRNSALREERVDISGTGDPMRCVQAYEALDHLFISGLLNYLDTLSEGREKQLKDLYLRMRGSDRSSGKLMVMKSEWRTHFPSYPVKSVPQFGYYQDTKAPDKPYRFYLMDNKEYGGVTPVTSESLSSYQWGELTMMIPKPSPTGGIMMDRTQDGFILDKNGRQLAESGIAVFASTEWANGASEAYRYEFDQVLGRMVFRTTYRDYLDEIIEVAGGVEQLRREQLIFIPDSEYSLERGWRIKKDDSETLLPFLCALESDSRYRVPSSLLRELINLMNQSLEEERVEEDALFLKKAVGHILQRPYPEAQSFVAEVTSGASASQPQAPIPEEKIEPVKATVVEASSAVGDVTAPDIPPAKKEKVKTRGVPNSSLKSSVGDDSSALAAESKVDEVEATALAELAKLKHLTPDQVSTILSEMATALSADGISLSGKVRGRGSHFSRPIIAEETGAATAMSVVRRPVNQGFRVGTVRKIIKDFSNRVRKISAVTAKA